MNDEKQSLGEQESQHAITSEVAEIMRSERKIQARLINERDNAREALIQIGEVLDSVGCKTITPFHYEALLDALREWRKAWQYIPKDARKHFIVAANKTHRVLKTDENEFGATP